MIHIFLPPERLKHVLLAGVFYHLLLQKNKRLVSAKNIFCMTKHFGNVQNLQMLNHPVWCGHVTKLLKNLLIILLIYIENK